MAEGGSGRPGRAGAVSSADSADYERIQWQKPRQRVTGRTAIFDDSSYCGHDDSASWQSSSFPNLSYTVCWEPPS